MSLDERIKWHKDRILAVADQLEEYAKDLRGCLDKDDLRGLTMRTTGLLEHSGNAHASAWHLYGIMQGAGSRDAR